MSETPEPVTSAERLATRLDELARISADLYDVARWLGTHWPPQLPVPQVAATQDLAGNSLLLQVWCEDHAQIAAVARFLAQGGGINAVGIYRDNLGPTYTRVSRRWGTVLIQGVIESPHVEGPILAGGAA
jgi:hypothetical protein